MNPSIKEKWVAALRSGNYKQTQERLRDESGHCCLGVLCEVFDPTRWLPDGSNYYEYQGDPSDINLPYTVKYEVGINSDNEDTLMEMNDSGKTFTEIADFIEKEM